MQRHATRHAANHEARVPPLRSDKPSLVGVVLRLDRAVRNSARDSTFQLVLCEHTTKLFRLRRIVG